MIGGIAATACADAAGYLLPAIIAGRRLIIAGDWARDAKLTRERLRRTSLTPSYVPPVEVLSDPNFKYRHIAVTQVEVGDVAIPSPE